jgi:alkylation response protein AidB-like acyl-CoA dehydrogenase
MNLFLTEEQTLLRDSVSRMLASESAMERVRAAEPVGFDAALWSKFHELGILSLRVPETSGGLGAGLFEAVLVAEQAGRHLASAPVLEAMAVSGLLARSPNGAEALKRLTENAAVIGLLPYPVSGKDAVIVPSGAIAQSALALRDGKLVLLDAPKNAAHLPNIGSSPLAKWRLDGPAFVLAEGKDAEDLFGAAVEEWRLLMAAALCGLSERALELAAQYANERIQFDRPIGTYQGISHPLADAISAIDGGKLLVWDAVSSLANKRDNAAALLAMAFAWAARSATYATSRAIHTFGGYGLALSGDTQLYFRRAKGWPLVAGDPQSVFCEVSDRTWRGIRPALPESGATQIELEFGASAEEFRKVVRDFFDANLDDELRAHADMSWDGYHPEFQKKLAQANLLFPTWPVEYGGQNRDAYDAVVLREEFHRAGWTVIPTGVTRLVAESLLKYGSDELKQEVLPAVTRGEVVFCLGYTEPGSGSDVGAAKTRAVPMGNQWVINGQKMFNSGANLAHYVFLLTRTDDTTSKHRGLTMFLVPMTTPGIEVFPFDTLSDERSNSTFFTDVRVPDRYRVGEVNGGWNVIRYALGLEHTAGYGLQQNDLVKKAADWALRERRGGGLAIEDSLVRSRLGLAATRARISWLLLQRGMWCFKEGQGRGGEGPMCKLFSAEAFLEDAQSLLDLSAPASLLHGDGGEGSAEGLNFAYRHAIASTNYGGTSEIMRSLVGQMRLGLPRDR